MAVRSWGVRAAYQTREVAFQEDREESETIQANRPVTIGEGLSFSEETIQGEVEVLLEAEELGNGFTCILRWSWL